MKSTPAHIAATAAIISILALGTLPFVQLLWNHPFESGTPDVIIFAQYAKETIDTGIVTARGNHGFFTALQLFPFIFLQSAIMSLLNSLHPLANLWIMQHIISFLNTGLFFILGRKLTRSTLGGMISATVSFMLLDIPIWQDAGFPRYLSTFQYSSIFLFGLLAFLPDKDQGYSPWAIRLLVIFLGSGMLFSHHHFGLVRITLFIINIIILIFLMVWRQFIPTKFLTSILQSLFFFLFLWLVSNLPYIQFFWHDFIGPLFFKNPS